MNNLAIAGCQGRMGKRIVVLAIADSDLTVSVLLEHPDHPAAHETMNGIPISTAVTAAKGCDALIDFTVPENTMKNLLFCRENGIRMVIGTTGLTPEQEEYIRDAAELIPIVYSSNMSVGVNILFKLTELMARAVPSSYMVNIREAHHIHKKDAPSGTAKTLAKIIKDASSKDVFHIESVREGEIVGDHDVMFESGEDIITIRHHAKSRDIFARGAIEAAKFLKDKQSGLFTMADVLGLSA